MMANRKQVEAARTFTSRYGKGVALPLVERIDALDVALARANRLIDVMSNYVGKMALSADDIRDLNEHGIAFKELSK